MSELIQILNGGIGVALVAGIFAVIQLKINAKSAEKTVSKEVTEKALRDLIAVIEDIKEANIAHLNDRITYLVGVFMERGSVSVTEHKNLLTIYGAYARIGGNGTITALMESVKGLPVR